MRIARTPRRLHALLAGRARRTLLALLLTASVLAAPTARAQPATGSASESGPGLGLMAWSFATDGPVRSSPMVWRDLVVVASTDGHVYGLDRASGEEVWRYDAGAPVASTPAVGARHVFVVDRASTVHAIRADNGSASWLRETGPEMAPPWGLEGWDYVLASPVLADGTLYVGSGDGAIYALDAADGAQHWRTQTGGRIRATPTVADGVVYVGSSDGIFHALRAENGSSLWNFETEGHGLDVAEAGFDRRHIYSGAAVANGLVYFGSRDANVYALNAATGEESWRTDDGTPGWVMAPARIHDGMLMITRSSSTRVRALDPATGREIWAQITGNAVFAPTVSLGDAVVVAGGRGLIVAYDSDGTELWRHVVAAAGIWSPPTAHESVLYVGADDGVVRAYPIEARPAPMKRVFSDSAIAERSGFGSDPAHSAVRNYFSAHGYDDLDVEGLQEFLSARIDDGAPSILIVSMDGWNPAYEGGDASLLRRYLERGGRVVWLGHAPGFLTYNDAGQITGVDREPAGAILGVDLGAYNTDIYGAWPTAEGRRRGLRSWWISGARANESPDLTVLARNEVGGVVAWSRGYGNGGEFINLYPTLGDGRLDEIRAVAEYGILRSPDARHVEASSSR